MGYKPDHAWATDSTVSPAFCSSEERGDPIEFSALPWLYEETASAGIISLRNVFLHGGHARLGQRGCLEKGVLTATLFE